MKIGFSFFKKIKRLFVFLLMFLLLFSLVPKSCYGWSEHGKTLAFVLEDVSWLKEYKDIEITPYTYDNLDQGPYSPDFKIQYREGKIGDKTDAFTILTTYADEPDWNMDKGLKLSKLQILTGDSQGWRHQSYRAFFGLLKAGNGHERVEHFYNLSREAFKKGDKYWGFRFLARSLHHIQDLTQPFHTMPASTLSVLRYIWDIKGFTAMCTNHHFTLEDYQEVQILSKRKDYAEALKSGKAAIIKGSIKDFAYKVAAESRKDVRRLWRSGEGFFGKKISSKEEYKFDKWAYKMITYSSSRIAYDEMIKKHLERFAIYSLTLLEFSKSDVGY